MFSKTSKSFTQELSLLPWNDCAEGLREEPLRQPGQLKCGVKFINSPWFFNAEDENMSIYAGLQFVWKVRALILQPRVQTLYLIWE